MDLLVAFLLARLLDPVIIVTAAVVTLLCWFGMQGSFPKEAALAPAFGAVAAAVVAELLVFAALPNYAFLPAAIGGSLLAGLAWGLAALALAEFIRRMQRH